MANLFIPSSPKQFSISRGQPLRESRSKIRQEVSTEFSSAHQGLCHDRETACCCGTRFLPSKCNLLLVFWAPSETACGMLRSAIAKCNANSSKEVEFRGPLTTFRELQDLVADYKLVDERVEHIAVVTVSLQFLAFTKPAHGCATKEISKRGRTRHRTMPTFRWVRNMEHSNAKQTTLVKKTRGGTHHEGGRPRRYRAREALCSCRKAAHRRPAWVHERCSSRIPGRKPRDISHQCSPIVQ